MKSKKDSGEPRSPKGDAENLMVDEDGLVRGGSAEALVQYVALLEGDEVDRFLAGFSDFISPVVVCI